MALCVGVCAAGQGVRGPGMVPCSPPGAAQNLCILPGATMPRVGVPLGWVCPRLVLVGCTLYSFSSWKVSSDSFHLSLSNCSRSRCPGLLWVSIYLLGHVSSSGFCLYPLCSLKVEVPYQEQRVLHLFSTQPDGLHHLPGVIYFHCSMMMDRFRCAFHLPSVSAFPCPYFWLPDGLCAFSHCACWLCPGAVRCTLSVSPPLVITI